MRVLILITTLLVLSSCSSKNTAWESNRYTDTTIYGWKIKANTNVIAADNSLHAKCITLLTTQLNKAQQVFPPSALPYLREMPIWLEMETPNNVHIQYHHNRAWLSEHGYDPAKANSIELTATEFVQYSQIDTNQIMGILIPGYYTRIVGNNNPQLLLAYNNARSNDNYNSVIMKDGKSKSIFSFGTAYDYYLALSASYFNISRSKPKTREELKAIDPIGYDKIEILWRVK
ncbi:MAG TPA: hypothetical protein VIX80_04620 [Candidatus Kapabacteria bacterium]